MTALQKCNKELEDKIKEYEKIEKIDEKICLSCILVEIIKIIEIIPTDCEEEIKTAKKIRNKIEKLNESVPPNIMGTAIPYDKEKLSKSELKDINNKIDGLIKLLRHKLSIKQAQ